VPRTRIVVNLDPEHDRYHRQSLIGWWDQERLRGATALVVGAGALGNELVKNLVLIGVGHVLVCDLDTIEQSNLARCVFFRPEDEGRPKALVLAERAAELNPDVVVTGLQGDVRQRAGLGLFNAVDIVLGGLDNREARLFVNRACWKTTTPWIDGAIEGLMGVARAFVPPHSACYECTLSEADRQLLARRRSCALLSRAEMLDGKVPTTATTASVIAAVQVQEAVKLLHAERLGPPPLAGAGMQFVGLTHDSYVVRYPRREDCLSHDTYELDGAEAVPAGTSVAALLTRARELLGADAVLELEHDLVLRGRCRACGHIEPLVRPAFALTASAELCPTCREIRQLEFAHVIDDASPLLERRVGDLHLPDADVIVARTATERAFFLLDGEDPIAACTAAAHAGAAPGGVGG
jgi:molybdopterin/thiamine biosynthesis adenylyltransferase